MPDMPWMHSLRTPCKSYCSTTNAVFYAGGVSASRFNTFFFRRNSGIFIQRSQGACWLSCCWFGGSKSIRLRRSLDSTVNLSQDPNPYRGFPIVLNSNMVSSDSFTNPALYIKLGWKPARYLLFALDLWGANYSDCWKTNRSCPADLFWVLCLKYPKKQSNMWLLNTSWFNEFAERETTR